MGQFVHPVGGKGIKGLDIVILVNCEYLFIRIHEHLVEHLSNNISICISFTKNSKSFCLSQKKSNDECDNPPIFAFLREKFACIN